MKKIFTIICIIFFPSLLYSQDLSIIQKIRTHPELKQELQGWIEQIIQEWKGEVVELEFPKNSIFKNSLAVFITAKKNGKVRGCMGTLSPREENLAQEIRKNLKLAFAKDPNNRPIEAQEIPGMEIYVSALDSPRLLSRPYQINPARDAILIRSGSKEAVALPGEAKTLRYLLAFLKSKAGIKNRESFQLYRLESETVDIFFPSSRP